MNNYDFEKMDSHDIVEINDYKNMSSQVALAIMSGLRIYKKKLNKVWKQMVRNMLSRGGLLKKLRDTRLSILSFACPYAFGSKPMHERDLRRTDARVIPCWSVSGLSCVTIVQPIYFRAVTKRCRRKPGVCGVAAISRRPPIRLQA